MIPLVHRLQIKGILNGCDTRGRLSLHLPHFFVPFLLLILWTTAPPSDTATLLHERPAHFRSPYGNLPDRLSVCMFWASVAQSSMPLLQA